MFLTIIQSIISWSFLVIILECFQRVNFTKKDNNSDLDSTFSDIYI